MGSRDTDRTLSRSERGQGPDSTVVVGVGAQVAPVPPRGPAGGHGHAWLDLWIAATAHAHDAKLYPANAADLRGWEDLVEIVDTATI